MGRVEELHKKKEEEVDGRNIGKEGRHDVSVHG